MNAPLKPLWRCPKCGKTFITRNIWHSCRRYDLKTLFEDCAPHVFRLYRKLESMIRTCGPVTVNVQKSGIAFQVRVRALGCVPRKSYLRVGFAFVHPRRHPRFIKIESYTPRFHAHWIRVQSEEELDAEVMEWIREAYARAAQKPAPENRSRRNN
jgi:hypothetical protein